MKKTRIFSYVVLFISFFIIKCVNVHADTCTNNELSRLKNLADKVELTYDYEWEVFRTEKNGDQYRTPVFTITATNLNKELKVMIENDYLKGDYKEFKNDGAGSGKITGFQNGDGITVTIRAFTSNSCSGKLLTTKKVKLPYLNMNYYDEVCRVYPEFKYCVQFTDREISANEFSNEFSKYLKSSNVSSGDNYHVSAISKHVFIIVVSVTIIVVIFSFLTVSLRKKKKNSL